MNDTSIASFRHHALQPRLVPTWPSGLSAYAKAFASHSAHAMAVFLFTNVCRTHEHGSATSDFYILVIKSVYCDYFRL